ncbi:hypothetical protein NRIC_18220 [Enterococcus florum]|uniref:Uncharacterized protein n=1 Tax=Enterococcus florum TaxID=2480627 RepID=A0A4P5PCC1_9ENTE|nr:EpaQ family protein [Enterococcus florum]GCF93931.1 hypothetical protein NRIC_18220 [Enterococcus florum]
MENMANRLQRMLLMLPIIGSYMIWLFGIENSFTLFLLGNTGTILFILLIALVVLNFKRIQVADWILVGLAIFSIVFFTINQDLRNSASIEGNLIVSVFLLLLVGYRLYPLDEIDRLIILGIVSFFLCAISVRLFVEIPKVLTWEQILQNSNSLSTLWLNVNAIGGGILFATMTSTIILKSLENGVANVFVVLFYLLGLAGAWICQSRTSLIVLLGFIIVDNLFVKKFFERNQKWIMSFILFFCLAPFLIYYLAVNTSVDLFTGRENIWKYIFEKWLSDPVYIQLGMGDYLYSAKNLGPHNGFLYLLSHYGIIGYVFVFVPLSIQIIKFVNTPYYLTKLQVSSLFGLFMVLIYSMMEESLFIGAWVPIMTIFLWLGFGEYD